MAKLKTYKADLIGRYRLILEISLICSLSIIVLAFKYFPVIESEKKLYTSPQELFKVEDIAQTTIEFNVPPPPPKPQIIIASPADEVLEDIEISSTELEINEYIAPPPPQIKDINKKYIVEEEPSFFVAVEEMPEIIGGIQALQSKIVYPDIARRAGVEGTVYVLSYVNEKGEVVKTEVQKGIGGGCDEAAQKAIFEMKFNPGKQRGMPVKVKVMIPVKFQLK